MYKKCAEIYIIDISLCIWQKQPPEVFCKKDVLKNFAKFTGKHLCQSLVYNKVTGHNFMKRETLAQVFSCELFRNFLERLFYRTPPSDCFSYDPFNV